ncbi:hypothetical protein CEP51_000338 [Fusarium floridanum]|uniref:Uncharacterized protein n=1 Tax=Fusarium floridanum TaxID=1325733 RepID=A0A428SNF3_9HYPO|nr:hypothetical protein CEP51_000338 [Fusarium floridanum]
MNNTGGGIYTEDQMQKWDDIVRTGWPTIISSSTWAIAVALITLLYQAVAVRLFRPYAMSLFWLLPEHHRTWDVDQVRVAIANTMSPQAALVSTPAYRCFGITKCKPAKGVALLWLLGALVLTVVPIFLPLLLARRIPVVQGIPGSIENCSPLLNYSNWMARSQYDGLLSWDMLRFADTHGYNYSGSTASTVGLSNDKDRVAISSECPDWAPACDRNNSFRVDVDYWVKQSEVGIGSKSSSRHAEFGVLTTCYKPEYRRKFLRTEEDGTNTYGLLYGTSSSTGGDEYVTEEFSVEERFCYGYDLFAHFNSSGPSKVSIWEPNSTLIHDGDLTLLFYHIRLILSPTTSDDPVFTTNNTKVGGAYRYTRAIVPIMCNTSYAYCPGGTESCVSLGGSDGVGEYLNNTRSHQGRNMGFLELMWINTWIPLLSIIPGSSESVYASRTLSLGSTQLAPREISGHAEIVRLALASRMVLLTSATRAVSNWRNYVSSKLPVWAVETTEEQLETCRLTLMESSGKITTSGVSILIVVLIGSILFLLTFIGPLLRLIFWKKMCVPMIRWRLRTAPHLHRMTVERGDPSRFWPGGATDEWPIGRDSVDQVGLVESYSGFHAVYRPDARLRYVPKSGLRSADEVAFAEENGTLNCSP